MLARLAARPRLLTATGVSALGLGLDFALTPAKQLRSISSPSAASIGSVELYQYEICPFCNKLKALLDLHRVPYATTEVNPLTKGEIKSWSGGYRKVPITLFGEEQVNDSPVIATRVMDELEAAGTIPKADAAHFRSASAIKWAEWSDKEFAVSDPAPLQAPAPHCTQWPCDGRRLGRCRGLMQPACCRRCCSFQTSRATSARPTKPSAT